MDGKEGKAVADNDRGQLGVGKLNKITEISVYMKGTRPESHGRASY
jgi:hypothetical protein